MIRVLGGALALAVVLGLVGCTPPSRAEAHADEVARALADELTPRTPQALDAEYSAQRAVNRSGSFDPYTRIETLGWSGRVAEGEEAVLTLRISVDLPEGDAGGFIPREPPSSAVRCWELVLRFLYDYDPRASELRGIRCPEGAATLAPDPVPLASMPDPGWTVVVEERDGVLVVALGAQYEGTCAVAVRHPDGLVEVLQGFSPESLLPGEIGCHPMLYLGGVSP